MPASGTATTDAIRLGVDTRSHGARPVAAPPAPSSATTVLCLHCSASSGRQWRPLAAALADRYDVACPDLPGYAAGLPWPAGTTTTLDAEADALEPLLDPAGVHLVGHSYGGAVALQLALRRPERVHSLTLYEPVRFALLDASAGTAASAAQIRSLAARVADDVARGALLAAGARFIDYWSGPGTWQVLDAGRQQAVAGRMAKVVAEFDAALADGMPAARYRDLTMPVHLIGGSRSPLPARQVLDVLAARIPQAARTTLSGLGHMGPVEDAGRVIAAVDVLLRGIELQQAA